MTSELAQRIAELRACDNVAELHIVALDEREHRALVCLVPKVSADASTDADWVLPSRPFMMLIDPIALKGEHASH